MVWRPVSPCSRLPGSRSSSLTILAVCLIALPRISSSAGSSSASDDAHWDDRFALAVLEGSQVRAVASTGTNVYFGGHFTTVGGSSALGSGVSATNIALWNGRHWAPLGAGVNGQ